MVHATHDAFKQPPPFGDRDLWAIGVGLREASVREGVAAFERDVAAYGALAGGEARLVLVFGLSNTLKGTPVRITSLVLLGLLLAYSSAYAQTRCSTDPYGTTTCRSSDGTTSRATTDAYGNTTYRRSDGTTTRATTDAYGNTTFRRSDGSTTRATTDSYGNTTHRHSDGSTTRATTDPYGNTTYRNSDGTTKRCSTDAYGNTTCR